MGIIKTKNKFKIVMAQYINKTALVAEIERKMNLCKQILLRSRTRQDDDYHQGNIDAYEVVISLLDTLEVKEVEEEPTSNDLEEAAKNHKSAIHIVSPQWTSEVEKAFKAGAEWQKEQIIDKACEWLRTNYEDIGIRYIRGHKVEDEIEAFKKAMEE